MRCPALPLRTQRIPLTHELPSKAVCKLYDACLETLRLCVHRDHLDGSHSVGVNATRVTELQTDGVRFLSGAGVRGLSGSEPNQDIEKSAQTLNRPGG